MKLYDENDEIKFGKEEIINQTTRKYILDETEVFCYFFEENENINIIFKKQINKNYEKKLLLHWGIFKSYPVFGHWIHPLKEHCPQNTIHYDEQSVNTEFIDDGFESKIIFRLPKNIGLGIAFEFFNPNLRIWYNKKLRDYKIEFNLNNSNDNVDIKKIDYKIQQIHNRYFNNEEIKEEDKSENIKLIEKKGKLNNLSKEEIKKVIKRTQLLEDMSIMGTITKDKIIKEKQTNPEKFISTENIIKQKNNNEKLYALGIFSKVLENQGITTAITKQNEKEKDDITMQFLMNGMSDKKKYNLHFDFGKEKNEKLLYDMEERKKFHDKLRTKLSQEFNINEEEIIITFPRSGSYQATIIFNSKDFELDEYKLISNFRKEKGELSKLKQIEKSIILDGCELNESMLDYRGNNDDGGWADEGEQRGGEDYIPPKGWIGYGLRVLDKYENNTWLGMCNGYGEWVVAYHGVANNQSPEEVAKIAGIIYKTNFIPSNWGKCTDYIDIRHKPNKCGLGVYCTPDIKYAEGYAGLTEFNGEKYKCVLMLRVKPDKIRQCNEYPKEYILEPTTDEIRPYRILLKKV